MNGTPKQPSAPWQRKLALRWLSLYPPATLLALLGTSSNEYRQSAGWYARSMRKLAACLSTEDTFGLIYKKNLWGIDETSSGTGSTLAETQRLRQTLPELLQRFSITSLLDVPCGDFNWMQHLALPGISYIGADIVAELIASNQQRHGTAQRRFTQLNLVTDRLPQVDAVFCRDCMVHLPDADVMGALQNIRASGAKYLLATTFPQWQDNEDVVLGFWRPINLQRPPYHLPPPLALLHEGNPNPNFADKSLGLWRVDSLPV